jgi:8-oxo-dGTP pyrophosphatase MutT (NUDIX family)
MNKNGVQVFISSIKYFQEINRNKLFKYFETIYKTCIKKLFRHCSVSICFRIHLMGNDIDKTNHIEKLNSYLESITHEKFLKIQDFEKFLQNSYGKDYDKIFNIDVLFIKRVSSGRDRYSGHIAFPGGKVEATDKSDYYTAVRETHEEVGFSLCDGNEKLVSKYLGPNFNFDLTIDLKYFVASHIFLIFDPLEALDLSKSLSVGEVAEAFFVPLDYFLAITVQNQNNLIKHITQDTLGSQMNIGKLILNNREDLLIFGMTMRKFLGLINLDRNYIEYREIMKFNNSIFRNILFQIFFPICKFLTNPYRVYSLLRFMLFCYICYSLFKYLL